MKWIKIVLVFLILFSCSPKKLSIYHSENLKPRANIVYLHGYGGNEKDFELINDFFSNDYNIYSIRAPYVLNKGSYSWFELKYNSNTDSWVQTKEAFKSIDMVRNFMNTLGYNTILIGQSQGAIIAMALAVNFPERIKYVVSINGYLDPALILNTEKTKRDLSIYLLNGENDYIINKRQVDITIKLLDQLKIKTEVVSHTNQHSISEVEIMNFKRWINGKGF